MQPLSDVIKDNGLRGPVAGTMFRVLYGEATNKLLCETSECVGQPIPAVIPGVTDGTECSTL